MTAAAIVAVWIAADLLIVLCNHGAHRLPTPRPSVPPSDEVRCEALRRGVWL